MQVKKRLDFSRLSNPAITLYEASKPSKKMSIKIDSASAAYCQEPKTQRYAMKQRFEQPDTFEMAANVEQPNDSAQARQHQSELPQHVKRIKKVIINS